MQTFGSVVQDIIPFYSLIRTARVTLRRRLVQNVLYAVTFDSTFVNNCLLFTKDNKFQIRIVLNLDTEIKVFKIMLRLLVVILFGLVKRKLAISSRYQMKPT